MSSLTHSEFLRGLCAGLGALAGEWLLGGCEDGENASPTEPKAPTTGKPTATATTGPATVPTPATGETPVPTPTAGEPATATTTAGETPVATATRSLRPPDLVVARGGEPEELVRRAMAALGGMERFVQPGYNVIIKPNICVAYHSYEYAATTNPWIVGALVKLCFEAGAGRVRVMDYPFGGTPEEAYLRSGIQEQVLAAAGGLLAASCGKARWKIADE